METSAQALLSPSLAFCVCVCVCVAKCPLFIRTPSHWMSSSPYFSMTSSQLITIKWSVSCSVMSNSLWPMGCSPPDSSLHGILPGGILEWLSFSSPGDLPNPGIELTSLALQADCLPLSNLGKFIGNALSLKKFTFWGTVVRTSTWDFWRDTIQPTIGKSQFRSWPWLVLGFIYVWDILRYSQM